ncbi:type II secretion system protein, partial [Thermovibrio sp.]
MQRKGFSLMGVMAAVVVMAILIGFAAPRIKAKIYEAKITKLANNMIALKDAESQFNSDTGSYAYAPRCFMDNSWASYKDVCGDPSRYAGPYVDMRVSGWVDCTLDPTASE